MRIVAAVAVIVAASLPASPLAAQDDVVLHEFVYTADDIGAVLADRPEGVPADDLTVEFEPSLKIRTSGSAVTAAFTDLAFSGSLSDGCSSRLAYSASSTEIATVGDGVFDVTMEGYWDWQYTFRAAAGDTGSICESKEQKLTELTGTVTVRMIDGTPFVDDALGIPVPLESFAPEPTPSTGGTVDTVLDQPADESDPMAAATTVADIEIDTDDAADEDSGDDRTADAAVGEDTEPWSPKVLLVIGLIILLFGLVGYLIVRNLMKRSPTIKRFAADKYHASLGDEQDWKDTPGVDETTGEPRRLPPLSAPETPSPEATPPPGYAWVWAPVTKVFERDDLVPPADRTVWAGGWYQGRRDKDGTWTIRHDNGDFVTDRATPDDVRLPGS